MSRQRVARRRTGSGPTAAVRPANVRSASLTMAVLAAVMLVLQVLNTITGYALNPMLGLLSREVSGLDGILFAPVLHGGWGHFFGNLTLLVLLGLLLFVAGVREFAIVTVTVWVIGGFGVWLFGPSNTVTIGSSSLVYGWLAYLVARGVFTRNAWQLLIGALLVLFLGSVLWTGIVHTAWVDLVSGTNVSWQGHLFGAAGGVLAAVLLGRDVDRRVARRRTVI